MPKKYITVSDEMDRMIQEESEKRGAPYALIVREAIREWADKRGIRLDEIVAWGGPRKTEGPEDQGQRLGLLAHVR